MTKTYSVISYTDEYKEAFKKINLEWLKEMFEAEEYDLKVLNDPEKYILGRKGQIYLIKDEHKALGTCALMEIEPGFFELTKMAVQKTERGKGLGRKLLDYMVSNVFNPYAHSYFLLTNKNCQSAIHLYENYGFKYDKEILDKYGKYYKRANVGMLYKPNKMQKLSKKSLPSFA